MASDLDPTSCRLVEEFMRMDKGKSQKESADIYQAHHVVLDAFIRQHASEGIVTWKDFNIEMKDYIKEI